MKRVLKAIRISKEFLRAVIREFKDIPDLTSITNDLK